MILLFFEKRKEKGTLFEKRNPINHMHVPRMVEWVKLGGSNYFWTALLNYERRRTKDSPDSSNPTTVASAVA